MSIQIIEERTAFAIRDFSLIGMIISIFVAVLTSIRSLGFDIKKFQFGQDLHDLDISDDIEYLPASRQLYIHRNTLVYRLDKLQKTTGLDLRVFEDAITFKIALMVVKYMKYMEDFDF